MVRYHRQHDLISLTGTILLLYSPLNGSLVDFLIRVVRLQCSPG